MIEPSYDTFYTRDCGYEEPNHSFTAVKTNMECSYEIPKCPQTPELREPKSIRFNETANCRHILHINDYTDEEIIACWHQRCEHKEIKKDVKFAVSLYEDGSLEEDTEDYCVRGLELHIPEIALRRSLIKQACLEATFSEQGLQWDENVDDPECLAVISQEYSALSQDLAKALAIQDQEDAVVSGFWTLEELQWQASVEDSEYFTMLSREFSGALMKVANSTALQMDYR